VLPGSLPFTQTSMGVADFDFPAPSEDADKFTIDVADGGFTLPRRTERIGDPTGASPTDRYTVVDLDRIEFIFDNPQHSQITMRIPELGEAPRTTTDGHDRFRSTLLPTDDDRYTLVLQIDDGPEQHLILWVQ
jgi:hypothetical protein